MKQHVEYAHPNVLLLITKGGHLIELFTPIRAVTNQQVDSLSKGTHVYIEAIATSKQYRIVYFILGRWWPYQYFKISTS